VKPEQINYITELDVDYGKALKEVDSSEAFNVFLTEWDYWLDESTKKLSGADWAHLVPLIEDCRTEGVEPEEKHMPAIELMMPAKIIRVSILAQQYKVPWGCAYIRMKEEGVINW
jgi:hypothetical protein